MTRKIPSEIKTKKERGGYKFAETITGMPLGTLYSLVSQGRIPHIRLGPRLILFARKDLENWLEQHSIKEK